MDEMMNMIGWVNACDNGWVNGGDNGCDDECGNKCDDKSWVQAPKTLED